MLFAITDIETVGSAPGEGTIIEIAICLHDGQKIIDRYETLINPEKTIPPFIVSLTGINQSMVRQAPVFEDVADEIFEILKDAVFVAHNVNFDFGFIKAEFDALGIVWKPQKLCTVRLARKSFPGHTKYGLSSVCERLEIPNFASHRAMGDAMATAILFDKCIEAHGFDLIHEMLSHGSTDIFLPQHIPNEQYERLPVSPGIYFFKNTLGQVIYVGKANNIKKRVRSHFISDGSERQQLFYREIASIEFELCGTELIAQLKEDATIRALFPKYNKAQKRKGLQYHVVSFVDQNGILRLQVNRGKSAGAIQSFSSLKSAYRWLGELKENYHIQGRWIGLHAYQGEVIQLEVEEHNELLKRALDEQKQKAKTFIIIGKGTQAQEKSLVLCRSGKLVGYAFVPSGWRSDDIELLTAKMTILPSSELTEHFIQSHLDNPKGIVVKYLA